MAAVGGCGGEDPERPTPPSHSHEASALGAGSHSHSTGGRPDPGAEAPSPARPPARLTRFTGEVNRIRSESQASAAVSAGAALEPGDALVIRGPGSADVDLADGGRVVLDADSELRIALGGDAQVSLVRGSLHLMVPAGLTGPRPPLRVSTPAASIDLGGSGEVFIVAHPSGATWVAVLAGGVTVANGELVTSVVHGEQRRRLRTVEMSPAHQLLVLTSLGAPGEGPSRLSEARAAAGAVTSSLPSVEPERAVEDAATRLDDALGWLEEESRRGGELTRAHRTASREGNVPESRRLQTALIQHSQQLFGLRQIATVCWERLLATAAARSPSSDEVRTRRDRVEGLLGD